jgi:arginyl-tRNA synthetase
MLFNPEESIEFHGYTGPFVQYTHARISAILRKASEQSIPVQNHVAPPERLHETELAVIQQLLNYPKVLQDAADAQAPSLIAQFVFELAKEYNRFYSEVSIFGAEDESKKLFRVILSAHVAETIRKAMQLLGIAVPERM